MKHDGIVKKITRSLLAAALAVVMVFSGVQTAFAEPSDTVWPEFATELTAASAIVIDADSGTILYGKDIHAKRYPASITKLMTALVVLEHCRMDETVTFTEEAVSHLESGATTAGISAGDTLSVEESLYALLLKSANEVANGLAIHVSGSIDEFAKLMTETAKELGCLNSDFRTPSGLTHSEHVTTAYDMALITKALLQNEKFLEIESHSEHKLPGTARYPDGLTIHMGHQMMQPGSEVYDERVFAGKTGFTTASGNTLVTCAKDGDRRVIAVVLKDKTPDHYKDTKALVDFGLYTFENTTFSDTELIDELGITGHLKEDGILEENGPEELKFAADVTLILPKDYDASAIRAEVETPQSSGVTVDKESGKGIENEGRLLANVKFTYLDRPVGEAILLDVHDPTLDIEAVSEKEKVEKVEAETSGSGTKIVLGACLAILGSLAIAAVILWLLKKKKEKERRERLRRRRRERLREINVSDEEFGSVMKDIRSGKKRE